MSADNRMAVYKLRLGYAVCLVYEGNGFDEFLVGPIHYVSTAEEAAEMYWLNSDERYWNSEERTPEEAKLVFQQRFQEQKTLDLQDLPHFLRKEVSRRYRQMYRFLRLGELFIDFGLWMS